jgi:prolyl oligopeptidase
MKPIIFFSLFVLMSSCVNNSSAPVYPSTSKQPVIEEHFGTEVVDNYRWLENDNSEETADWVIAQNDVTFDYLKKIPFRSQLKERLEKLWNYEKLGAPFKEGNHTYYYKNDGLQNQYVVYREDAEGNSEVFLDPNKFSEDGTVSLGGLSFTKDGSKAAYSISEGGSDWRKVIVLDVESKVIIEDTIVDVKFSGISWKNNEGFFIQVTTNQRAVNCPK